MDPVLDTHQNTTRGNRTHRSSRSTQRTTSRTRGNDSSRAQDEAGATPSYQMLTTNLVQDLRAVEAKVRAPPTAATAAQEPTRTHWAGAPGPGDA